jgi:hypothetical protein
MWEDFVNNNFQPPRNCDFYHPFLLMWQDLYNSLPISTVYNEYNLSYITTPVALIRPKPMPSPLLFVANKHMIENKLPGVLASELMSVSVPNIPFDWKYVKAKFNVDFSKKHVGNNLGS